MSLMKELVDHRSREKIVRAARLRDEGRTQRETAEAVGVSRRTVIRWEGRPELWEAARDVATDSVTLPARQEPGSKPRIRPGSIPSTDTCNARTRAHGGPCQREAGWGTDHAGIGRCKLHGGSAVSANLKHGRYSTVKHEQLAEMIREMEEDPDPLNTIPELATARALLKDWLDRYQDFVEALHRWNEAEIVEATIEERKPRPKKIPEVQDALPLLEAISKAVKRVEDARNANAISRPELHRLMGEMGRVVAHHADDGTAQAIRNDWLTIRL